MSITGPFSKVVSTTVLYKYQQWYRQPAPYTQRLSYEMVWRYCPAGSNSIGQSWSGNAGSNSFNMTTVSPCYAEALNKAYDRFRNAVYQDESMIAVNLAERKQAMGMMAQRAGKVLKFAKAMKSLRFGEAAQALGLSVVATRKNHITVKKPRYVNDRLWRKAKEREDARNARKIKRRNQGESDDESDFEFDPVRYRRVRRQSRDTVELRLKRHARSYADNFLEFHFGWAPLVSDIHSTALLALENPVKGTGYNIKSSGYSVKKLITGNPAIWYNLTSRDDWSEGVCLRANVVIVDGNKHLAQSMGLLNPLTVAWELVPFSFVVDWFANVGDILGSYTDFSGLALTNSTTTRFIRLKQEFYYNNRGPSIPHRVRNHVTVKRVMGISKPILAIRPWKGFSVTRGLTAVSLLTQFLRRV